ncbi:MAG: hypothetical protein GY799_00045, partial [Desulfobulbaceae bacterium]|nr:hypothetical protein [Desulfobulbaceae bacterium]
DGEGTVSTTTQGQMIYRHMFRLAQALKYPVNHAAHTVDGVEYTTIRQAVDQMRQWKWDAEDKQKNIYQLQDQHVKCMQSYERVISNYQRSIQEVETVKLVPDWLFCGDARANKMMMPMYPLVAFAQEESKSSISLDRRRKREAKGKPIEEEGSAGSTMENGTRNSLQLNEEKKKFIQQMLETMEQQIPTVIQRRKEPGQEEKEIQAINMNSMRVNVEEQYGIPEGIPLAPVLAPLIRTQMMIAGFPYTIMLDSGASASVVPRWFVLEIIGKFGKDWVQKRLRPSFTMLHEIANGTLKARYELILCVDTGSTVVAIPFVI